MENWSAMIPVIALAAPAFADATADARAHDEAFAKACEAGDVDAAHVWLRTRLRAAGDTLA